jgi:hypothetical protein
VFDKIFSNSRQFAIEVSAAASINDIVSLWDTFTNSGNYGVVFENNSYDQLLAGKVAEKGDFKVVFIDHLPNVNNATLFHLHCVKNDSIYKYEKL